MVGVEVEAYVEWLCPCSLQGARRLRVSGTGVLIGWKLCLAPRRGEPVDCRRWWRRRYATSICTMAGSRHGLGRQTLGFDPSLPRTHRWAPI